MSYPELSFKFKEKRPPVLSKWEIDGSIQENINRGCYYIPSIGGPEHVEDYRQRLYQENGIEQSTVRLSEDGKTV